MPLSEQELRTLEQLEAQLRTEDPRFVSTMNRDPARRRRRQRAAAAAGIALVGLAVVIAGALLDLTWLGLVGAVVIGLGAIFALQGPKGADLHVVGSPRTGMKARPRAGAGANLSHVPRAPRASAGASPFMARLEERWERRRRENQGW